jgi:uncharacterized membrane protein
MVLAVLFLTGGVSLADAQSAAPVASGLQLCNRTSYVLDLALGLETKGTAATRGWFRVDPGQCRTVLQGAVDADHVYVHARAPALYPDMPTPQARHAELCIADSNFVIAGARKCPSSNQHLAGFTEVKPTDAGAGLAAHLSEEADYPIEQARLAGVQRLLVALGYDAEPIDGIEGRKTEAALAQFLKDRKLASATAEGPGFFDVLMQAVEKASGAAFTWCNDTRHAVMAALGAEENNGIVTRGWYRVTAGRCLKPELHGRPAKLFSFAEAVDDNGRVIRKADKALAWGGPVVLCTRALAPTGFVSVELGRRKGATIRFKE